MIARTYWPSVAEDAVTCLRAIRAGPCAYCEIELHPLQCSLRYQLPTKYLVPRNTTKYVPGLISSGTSVLESTRIPKSFVPDVGGPTASHSWRATDTGIRSVHMWRRGQARTLGARRSGYTGRSPLAAAHAAKSATRVLPSSRSSPTVTRNCAPISPAPHSSARSPAISSNMLGGASQIVSMIRVKCNGT